MTEKELIINVDTKEETYIDITGEKLEALNAMHAAAAEEEAARVAAAEALAVLKASARAKLVAGQALTEEEAATIVI